MPIIVKNNLRWSQVVNIYINELENPSVPDDNLKEAKEELRNMARVADLYVASQK